MGDAMVCPCDALIEPGAPQLLRGRVIFVLRIRRSSSFAIFHCIGQRVSAEHAGGTPTTATDALQLASRIALEHFTTRSPGISPHGLPSTSSRTRCFSCTMHASRDS